MNTAPLLQEDKDFLDSHHPNKWEIKEGEGGAKYLIISSFKPPQGYTPEETTLMLIIPQGYPMAQIDMFYFDPHVEKINGNGINALTPQTHLAKGWQQWSRHYDPPWNPDEDNIAKHIQFVSKVLKREASQ